MNITVSSPQKLRKVGNSIVVTIPADVVEQHNLKPDDLVILTFSPLALVPKLRPDLAQIAEDETVKNVEALRYLRDN